ncbi:hypothetical protein [Pedobacter foliorum]|uniref:hypothetical protein n=1 Tax=Pedobacter foliorum TaxID=2739058 RepID=UPI001567ACED|nr:hypothetical protein [Pedobacter foliorum]NRF41103.1 hypothetical protein [Pedobacter foliorum]
MKSIFITFSLLLLIGSAGKAQTWAEFFKQKKTQRTYLAQQVAGLKVYLSFGKQGYHIIQDGLNTINSLKKGDFNLHKLFFNQLKNPSAKIKNLSLLADIAQLQGHTLNLSARYLEEVAHNKSFHPEELSYQHRVFQRLRASCAHAMEECYLLTEDNQLELSDDQRINRLQNLHHQMLSHLEFCKSFVQQGITLVSARTSELRGLNLELRLTHLNPTR